MYLLNILVSVLSVVGVLWAVIFSYKLLFAVVGFFKYRKFHPTENFHSYAICIAARNEESVITNLLDSISNQDYPNDKLTVFVIAHNCTDDTARRAREWKSNGLRTVVYEKSDDNERTKGFALKYLFEQIEQDHGIKSFDGYFIFDADNVITKNYITKMNEAFDEGNKIITSFRSSKNINQNWISFSYAMHWMRTCLFENRGKGILKQACRIQGTGFLFSNELVKDGWKYTSLTEDRSFCSDAVIQNYKISYCDEAVFYDEQPYRMKIALRQRLRWAKGHLYSAVENCPKLLKNMLCFKNSFTTSYDCFCLNLPRHIEGAARKLLRFALKIALTVIAASSFNWILFGLIVWLGEAAFIWISNICIELLVLIKYRNRIEPNESVLKRILHIVLFPLFDIIGKWCILIALFKKIEWKPIPHESVINIQKLKIIK